MNSEEELPCFENLFTMKVASTFRRPRDSSAMLEAVTAAREFDGAYSLIRNELLCHSDFMSQKMSQKSCGRSLDESKELDSMLATSWSNINRLLCDFSNCIKKLDSCNVSLLSLVCWGACLFFAMDRKT